MKKFYLTIDLECDWGISNKFSNNIVLERLLLKLSHYEIKATFFISTSIVGNGLEKKDILKIHNAGHEVASHGHRHLSLGSLTKEEILDDLITSKDILEGIISTNVLGYRSPFLSKHKDLKAIVKEAGYLYHSSCGSLYPVLNNIRGHNNSLGIGRLCYLLPASLTYMRLLYPFSSLFKVSGSRIFFMHLHELEYEPSVSKTPFLNFLSINSGKKGSMILFNLLKKLKKEHRFELCREISE